MPTYPQGDVDVVDSAGAQSALQKLEAARELAVDLEADSMHAFRARLCFLQVATDDDVFLFDTLQPGVEARLLAPLLADPERTKYFHAAQGDLQFLAEGGVRVRGLFDTHRAATLLGWPKVGLADVAREKLGVELPKEHQQSDFSLRPLPPGMHTYIANDVRYLCELGRQVRESCREAGILEEVVLDCDRLCDEAVARPDVGADFKPKLPRSGLSPTQLTLANAIAHALHRKRLEWAEQENVPMGRMLSNMALADIATRLPSTPKDLARAAGVRGAFVRAHGDEVLAIVRAQLEKSRNGELPQERENKGPKDTNRRKREDALKAFRVEKATERKVTPSVVLTNPLMDALLAQPPRNLEELGQVPYFGDKRLQLYGPALIELLAAFPVVG
ncbi:HRDC domain-containing protein [Myxococcus sp. CA051A]|uniref:Ribonuclease D n=1 Tax=Myxococcus llanfairpwllgwyngyllgogerychwyrndrobwllllantysiliogogogochensis TaxID=2590453 RepID=A0A540WTF7_9BACT|nr:MULTISPECIES: ribonuclease D [Myxococcus]NTX15845.1 HRDC domain-containing protein [Myxococcus sp. CA056]NTX33965.1 HRDC domain-containing protein [Myxococcus sp. CA033]NTX53432.1 HRDC domain-containing protein [Myxococcus sp. CA039A]NTX65286.1 HRDC domain-containing protein [Myxococcus sp. CA051A]TQF12305.1 ribonuclease D [Myxococcus llanfairpwllgwyngyllgogerychwyrndrobwllllantysiliogogogochensis]